MSCQIWSRSQFWTCSHVKRCFCRGDEFQKAYQPHRRHRSQHWIRSSPIRSEGKVGSTWSQFWTDHLACWQGPPTRAEFLSRTNSFHLRGTSCPQLEHYYKKSWLVHVSTYSRTYSLTVLVSPSKKMLVRSLWGMVFHAIEKLIMSLNQQALHIVLA